MSARRSHLLSRQARAVPLVGAVAVGIMASVQSRLNGELSQHVGDGLRAAVWSFGSGLVILCVVVAISEPIRAGLVRLSGALRAGVLPRWQVLGGLFGGFLVGVQSAVVPLLGVAVFTVATVAGQSSNSLVVDRIGLGPAGRQAITGRRVASAVLAVVAVVIAVSDRFGVASFSLVAVAFAVLAGLGIAVQQAINGRVAQTSGHVMSATFVNFAFGTAGLVLALACRTVVNGEGLPSVAGAPWWAYLGGALGIVFIAIAAWVVPILGVLLFALLSIAGQLSGALLLDVVAPTRGTSLGWHLVVGVVLAFGAVALAARRPAT